MSDRLTVDHLANEIRRMDGSHSLGAGALAECLLPWLAEHDREKDDRIEALEAARDGYRALSRNHNADAVAQRGRADRADARLARVTDDSMLERIAPLIADMTACGHCDGSCGQCREDARRVLATIRAVAADSETVVNRDDDGKVVAADEQEAPNA